MTKKSMTLTATSRPRRSSSPARRPRTGRTAVTLALLAAGVTGSSLQMQANAPVVVDLANGQARQESQSAAKLEVTRTEAPAAAVAVAVAAPVVSQVAVVAVAAPALQPVAVSSYDEHELRTRLRWMEVRVGSHTVATPDPGSRVLLVRAAAQRAALGDVGLDWRDVYGVINAETSWVPRTGIGRNGVVSHGIAQFEPATARALGLRNPNDVVAAVHAAAVHLREAAQWSARRIANLGLTEEQRAAKLREGVSVYYNLSSRGRRLWSGTNTAQMPFETRRHIFNVQEGARLAERMATPGAVTPTPSVPAPLLVAAAERAPAPRAQRTRAAAPRNTAPREVGTISWSGKGGQASGSRKGTYVVWSNGKVSRQPAAGQHGALTWTPRQHVG
jgi:hypothetical protein